MLDEPVRGAVPDRSLYSLSGLEQLRAFMRGLLLPGAAHLVCFLLAAGGGFGLLATILWTDRRR